MRPTNIPKPHRRSSRRLLPFAAAAVAALSFAATSDAASGRHPLKLNTAMFAAQVGSISTGGGVYAGALVDPRLGHGAVVFSTKGRTTVRVTFHEYFPRGSMKGTGRVTLIRGSGGQVTLTGSLTIHGGTAKYRHARGTLTANGTINKAGMVQASLDGPATY
jgi:hypothetical protein